MMKAITLVGSALTSIVLLSGARVSVRKGNAFGE